MWILEMAENPRKIEWNAYKNFVLNLSSEIHLKIHPKISPNIRPRTVQKIRPKIHPKIRPENPSKKSVQKIRPKIRVIFQVRKSSPKSKFWGRISSGRPRGYPGGRPGQKLRSGPRNPGKTSILVRTSMTRRRGRPRPEGVEENFSQKNFGLNFRSLIF